MLAQQQIEEIVDRLNVPMIRISWRDDVTSKRKEAHRFDPMQEELKSLVKAWQDSGPDLNELFASNPDVRNWQAGGRMSVSPTPGPRGYLDWHPESRQDNSPKNQALELFMLLITNPNWESLGGPCARCKRYYLKRTKRQKVYCSGTCARKQTATTAMQTKRKKENSQKIALARNFIAKAPRSADWKRWVTRTSGITLRWLTRAINDGRLSVPFWLLQVHRGEKVVTPNRNNKHKITRK